MDNHNNHNNHNKQKHICSNCEKKFANKQNLQRHRQRHCPSKKVVSSTERPPDFNLRNRLSDTSDKLPNESLAAWKKRKFFPPKKQPVHLEIRCDTSNTGSTGEQGETNDNKKTLTADDIRNIVRTMLPNEPGSTSTTSTASDQDKESKIDIVCLAKGDYIKKLIQLCDGDEEKAMNYIKNIGIATDFLEGDFRLIKKVYFDGKKKSQFPIRIKDFKRNKLEYLEENGEWILDIRGEIVGKRLCENIVSTLLIANTQFNEVIIAEKDEDRKELLLDLFQINKTQAHIMKLLERKTQGKLSRRVAEFINYCTEVHAETGSLDNVKKAYD